MGFRSRIWRPSPSFYSRIVLASGEARHPRLPTPFLAQSPESEPKLARTADNLVKPQWSQPVGRSRSLHQLNSEYITNLAAKRSRAIITDVDAGRAPLRPPKDFRGPISQGIRNCSATATPRGSPVPTPFRSSGPETDPLRNTGRQAPIGPLRHEGNPTSWR